MAIPLPDEMVLYYESPDKLERLLCWIPFKELERLVNESKVKPSILEDYPDGLDIEINEKEMKRFKELYDLHLGIEPQEAKLIVDAIFSSKDTKDLAQTNQINLETLLSNKNKFVSKVRTIDQAPIENYIKTLFLSTMLTGEIKKPVNPAQKKIDEVIKGMDLRLKNNLFKVKFTEGDENPIAVFETLLKQNRKG
jgi:hypothetical protein